MRNKLEARIRRLRQAVMQTEDAAEIERIGAEIEAAKKQLAELPRDEPVGPYSGLTRRELALTRTCETDWF